MEFEKNNMANTVTAIIEIFTDLFFGISLYIFYRFVVVEVNYESLWTQFEHFAIPNLGECLNGDQLVS